MQFWKDTVDQIYAVSDFSYNYFIILNSSRILQGNPPQQPIALALAEALKTSNMSAMWMKRIITERVSINSREREKGN